MRLSRALLAVAAASTFAAGAAFAEDSYVPEQDYLTQGELMALEEAHGVDLYEVTGYVG
jgi:hypothetical protein